MPKLTTDELYTEIGNKIKVRRIALGVTQQDLASAIDTKRTSITNLEAGQQCIPLDKLYSLCDFLEINIHDVIPPLLPRKTDRVTIDVEVSPRVAAMIRSLI